MKQRPFLAVVALLAFASCGLAERDDESSKSYEYLTFIDPKFEAYCLESFDTNYDGRLSRYEAESVRVVECPNQGIRSLAPIDAFSRLETLNCAHNEIERITLTKNLQLVSIDCSSNPLTELSLGRLRRLESLDCHDNQLTTLDLQYTSSLRWLDCRQNRLSTLDLTACSPLLQADTRLNPDLTIIYRRAEQQVNFDAPSSVIVR